MPDNLPTQIKKVRPVAKADYSRRIDVFVCAAPNFVAVPQSLLSNGLTTTSGEAQVRQTWRRAVSRSDVCNIFRILKLFSEPNNVMFCYSGII